MASRKIEELVPELRDLAREHVKRCKERGVPIVLTCTARDKMEQMALYAQGRMKLQFVNMLRKEAGLWEIGEKENGRKVTWTLNSRHVVDLRKGEKATAYDVCLVKQVKGKKRLHWNLKEDVNGNDITDYEEVCRIGEELGLQAGGRWRKPDWPHFQLKT